MKRSGSAQLGRSLYAAIREDENAQLAFQADKLLHLLPPNEILAAARGRIGALYSLSWRRLAQQQPGAALTLIRLALASCEHPLALQSRWKLVRQHLPLPCHVTENGLLDSSIVVHCIHLPTFDLQ